MKKLFQIPTPVHIVLLLILTQSYLTLIPDYFLQGIMYLLRPIVIIWVSGQFIHGIPQQLALGIKVEYKVIKLTYTGTLQIGTKLGTIIQ